MAFQGIYSRPGLPVKAKLGRPAQDGSLPAAAREDVPASGGFREAWGPPGPGPGRLAQGQHQRGPEGPPALFLW
ncbi:MAG: hypothetical protein LBP92_12765 [Deltaproteobacteria bacterium]|nr:hypothetical protein [Deltaproteobacteria bacterium]